MSGKLIPGSLDGHSQEAFVIVRKHREENSLLNCIIGPTAGGVGSPIQSSFNIKVGNRQWARIPVKAQHDPAVSEIGSCQNNIRAIVWRYFHRWSNSFTQRIADGQGFKRKAVYQQSGSIDHSQSGKAGGRSGMEITDRTIVRQFNLRSACTWIRGITHIQCADNSCTHMENDDGSIHVYCVEVALERNVALYRDSRGYGHIAEPALSIQISHVGLLQHSGGAQRCLPHIPVLLGNNPNHSGFLIHDKSSQDCPGQVDAVFTAAVNNSLSIDGDPFKVGFALAHSFGDDQIALNRNVAEGNAGGIEIQIAVDGYITRFRSIYGVSLIKLENPGDIGIDGGQYIRRSRYINKGIHTIVVNPVYLLRRLLGGAQNNSGCTGFHRFSGYLKIVVEREFFYIGGIGNILIQGYLNRSAVYCSCLQNRKSLLWPAAAASAGRSAAASGYGSCAWRWRRSNVLLQQFFSFGGKSLPVLDKFVSQAGQRLALRKFLGGEMNGAVAIINALNKADFVAQRNTGFGPGRYGLQISQLGVGWKRICLLA
ncbi:hypothetical protein D3C75_564090 [compost metagenome]